MPQKKCKKKTKIEKQRDFLLDAIEQYSVGAHPIPVDYHFGFGEPLYRCVHTPQMKWPAFADALTDSAKEVLKEYRKI